MAAVTPASLNPPPPKDQRIQCANVYLPGRIQLGNLLGQGGGEGHGCKTTLQMKTSRSSVGEIKLVVKLHERRKKWRALGKKKIRNGPKDNICSRNDRLMTKAAWN